MHNVATRNTGEFGFGVLPTTVRFVRVYVCVQLFWLHEKAIFNLMVAV